MNKAKKCNLKVVLLLGVSLVFLTVSVINLLKLKCSKDSAATLAEITEIKQEHILNKVKKQAVVTYLVDGTEYSTPLDYFSSDMKVGNKISIIYNSKSPSHAVCESEYIAAIISFGSLGVLAALGAIIVYHQAKQS